MIKSILFPDNCIRTNETDWLLQNMGRVSVALETETKGIVDIVAYSDNYSDIKNLRDIALKKGGYIIKNISERGVDYID